MAFFGNANLQAELNRLANGGATYPATMRDMVGAANAWAGTSNLTLLGALNAKAGTSGIALDLVANVLAGTSGFSATAALQQRAT
jgi:hypothetical protein